MQVPKVRQARNPRCTAVTRLPPRVLLNRCVQYQHYAENNPDHATTSNPDSRAENACQLRIPENCMLVREAPVRGGKPGQKSGWQRQCRERQIPGIQTPRRPRAARRGHRPEAEWPARRGQINEVRSAAATIGSEAMPRLVPTLHTKGKEP